MAFAFIVGLTDIIPLLVFAGIVAAIWAVLSAISQRNSRAQERLARISRPASLAEIEDPRNAAKKERFAGVVETAKALSRPLMPKTELEQSQLRIRLANAGFRSDSAVSVYLGLRFVSLANFQLQMGRPRREVLHDLGVRTGVDDVRSLAAILIQADRFGSSIAQALRVQSDSMRTRRKQIAEEKAAKTAVQMIFPLVLFIFPGIFVVLVGPAAVAIYQRLLKK